MSLRRVLGGALAIFLLVTTFTLAQKPASNTSVLGEGASIDPHTYAEPTPPTQDENTYALEDHLPATTTTQHVTTTSAAEAETTSTASSTADEQSTATTSPPANNPTTTVSPDPTTTAPSGGYDSGAESTFASNINSLRAANGLVALSRNASLDAEARAWSKTMAGQASLSHSGIGRLIPPWSSVAENVGTGPSVSAVFNALAGSPTHLDHMLGSYTALGVGVWIDSNGILWTTHIFAK